jgi:hypothetical protein
MNSAIFADPASSANYGVGTDLCVFADVDIFANYGVGADADVRDDLREGRDDGSGMDTCSNRGAFHEQGRGFGEG